MSALGRAVLLALALAALALLAFAAERVAQRGRFTGAYSSYGAGPRGVRALYLLAARLGGNPARWSSELADLPPRALLVAFGDCDGGLARPLSRYEREELLRFVERGGVLLVAGARDYLPAGLGVRFGDGARCGRRLRFAPSETPPGERAKPARVAWSVPVSAKLRGLSTVPFREPGELSVEGNRSHEVLLSSFESGGEHELQTLALALKQGEGSVVVLASASMFENAALLDSDGGALFSRLLRAYAPAGPLLFDEYHLGIGERRSLMRYLRGAGATPWVLQLLLLAVVALARPSARFGGVRAPAAPPPAGTESFVAAMGVLYASARDPASAIECIARHALARVAAHHHLELGPARVLARALEERGTSAAAGAVREISEAQASVGAQRDRLALLVARIDDAVARATS